SADGVPILQDTAEPRHGGDAAAHAPHARHRARGGARSSERDARGEGAPQTGAELLREDYRPDPRPPEGPPAGESPPPEATSLATSATVPLPAHGCACVILGTKHSSPLPCGMQPGPLTVASSSSR